MRTFPAILIIATVFFSGCSDSSGPKVGPAANVVVMNQASVNQQGVVGQVTPIAPSVVVTDANNRPVPGVSVIFVITSGGGTLSSASALTGSSGQATITWTLGTAFGTKTMTATVQGLPPVSFTATAIAPDVGIVAFDLTDPASDTLPNNTVSTSRAIDLLSVHGDYKRDSLIVTFTFSAPVTFGTTSPNSLLGYFEFDIDDNATTGDAPISNVFGGSANARVDYVGFLNSTATTGLLANIASRTTQPVTAQYSGNSMTMRIPMSLLGNDDGNFTYVGVIGTVDRPTDIFPNAGAGTARRSLGISPSVLAARIAPSVLSASGPATWRATFRVPIALWP